MATQIVNARIDERLKQEVETILSGIGLTGGEAIRLFYTQVRNQRGIPFKLTLPEANKWTQAEMLRARHYLFSKEKPDDFKSFDNVDDLMNDLVSGDAE